MDVPRLPSDLRLEDLTSNNPQMQRCLTLATEAARSRLPILLLGESGTGKTLLAHAIHNSSPRRDAPFISFNASAMSDTLLESQLFGHEKGAFTGAAQALRGKFEMADNGSLFFDEIADMSPAAQAKILRAVEYGEFERLGSEITMHADVRIISATNKSLRRLAIDGLFREDLYHRLNGITLLIPPLRKRPEDLPGLIASEFQAVAHSYEKDLSGIDPAAFRKLIDYLWPGNLRELHRVVQTAVLFARGDTVQPDDVVFDEEMFDEDLSLAARFRPEKAASDPAPEPEERNDLTLETAILQHIAKVYQLCGENKRKTARILDISRGRLDRYMKKAEARSDSAPS